MKVNLPKESVEELERNESTFRVRHIDREAVGQIMDKNTGRVYATASGANEQEAVENAIVEARGAEKPKTPAQILEENNRLRQENKRLKGEGDKKPAPTDNGDGEKPADDPVAEMTNPELKQTLKSRSIPLPDGDTRTKEWRDKAEKALRDAAPKA